MRLVSSFVLFAFSNLTQTNQNANLSIEINKPVITLNISNKVLTTLHQLFTKMPSRRMKYTAKFKFQVVKFAKETNNCTASWEFCVNEKLVRDWRKQIEKLKCMPKNKCSNQGKKCQWPELEDKLIVWIKEQRQSGYIVNIAT